jgi:hypothetical protein
MLFGKPILALEITFIDNQYIIGNVRYLLGICSFVVGYAGERATIS